jgi:hypothetical protein
MMPQKQYSKHSTSKVNLTKQCTSPFFYFCDALKNMYTQVGDTTKVKIYVKDLRSQKLQVAAS